MAIPPDFSPPRNAPPTTSNILNSARPLIWRALTHPSQTNTATGWLTFPHRCIVMCSYVPGLHT
ncbi:hypothetical protein CVT26_004118 [Gymnopilus dilepis]|uniref:Uncharacterized protein n=1 Tax=Gymnopilus dilepis TaxID=231916 RepID=A0A409YV89_9AGAR|nr:hypothetical protein CVT26_004118 [Gymnopilus dilepis]